MKSPYTGNETIVVTEIREMTFRKEHFKLSFHAYKCVDTGKQFEDETFAELNYNQIVNQYRAKHSIPFPEQIKAIREMYGLSAAKMAEILGMGSNSWRNYESGEVPSKVHGNLIQMISNVDNFKKQVELYSEITNDEKSKIVKKISHLKNGDCCCNNQLLRFKKQPDILNGYKPFNTEKAKQIILFFAELQRPFKTKMNKLLWYTDNYHFRKTAQSISGLEYVAIPYGPVPNQYEYLYEALNEEQIISKEAIMIPAYGEVEKIVPFGEMKFDPALFSESEMESLKYVAEQFKDTTASEIAELSHQEKAWMDNIEGRKKISFMYAFDLVTI